MSSPVRVSDSSGAYDTQTVTITITGTNDAPVATFSSAQITTEDASSITGILTANDIDTGDVLTYALVGDPIPGLTITPSTGSWSFNPNDTAYQNLALGEILDISVNYSVTDSEGANDTDSFQITVTGSNDPVVISSATSTLFVNADSPNGTGSILFTDLDIFDGHSATVSSLPSPEDAYGVLTLQALASPTPSFEGFIGSPGQLNWTYQVDPTRLASLASGTSHTETYLLSISDGNGSTESQTVTVVIQGNNNAPAITAAQSVSQFTYSDAVQPEALIYTLSDPDGQSLNPTFTIERFVDGIWESSPIGAFESLDEDTFIFNGPGLAGLNDNLTFSRSTTTQGDHWTLAGHAYLPVGHYRFLATVSDGTQTTTASPVVFTVAPESLNLNWAAAPLLRTEAAAISAAATGNVPINLLLSENDSTAGGLNTASTAVPGDLKVQVIDQISGQLLASSAEERPDGVALLSFETITDPTSSTGAVIRATASISQTLAPSVQARHYALRTIVSGQYYNLTGATENTMVTLSRPDGVLAAVTDNLSSNGGYGISGVAVDIRSASSDLANRLFSAEFTGTLPSISSGSDPLTGNFLLRSTTINGFTRTTTSSSAIVSVSGQASLFRIDRSVDPLTGLYNDSALTSAVATGISFTARMRDFDLSTPELPSGIYDETYESRNTFGTNGSSIDLVSLVAYKPSTTSILFSTDGDDPIKFSTSSPLNPSNPLFAYQPNALV